MEENSANALIMAGGVLIAIMLISLAVYVFNASSNFAKTYYSEIDAKTIQAFNNKFEIYTRGDVTAQDIVSVANLARDTNITNEVENDKKDPVYIQVVLYNGSIHLEDMTREELYQFMEENSFIDNDATKGQKKYKCKDIQYNENTQRVNKIVFELQK